MKTKLRILTAIAFTMIALFCLSCSSQKNDRLLGSVSDPSVELMSHDFRYIGEYDGWHYGAYNAGYNSTKEHPQNLDIDLKMVRWQTDDIEHREIKKLWIAGKGISDDFRPPYDPAGIIEGSTMHVLFCPGVGGHAAYCHLAVNLDTQEIGEAQLMTLDGKELNIENVLNTYTERTGIEIPWHTDGGKTSAFGIGMNVEVAQHGGYYYSVISALAYGFTAIVVKSEDMINWKTVSIPDFSSLDCGTAYWEGVVHPLYDDNFAFAARVQSNDGVIYGTWNSVTTEFSNLQLVKGGITSRPEFFDYKGGTYLFCNVYGPSDVEGYGSVYRSTAAFYKLSDDGSSIEFVRNKFVPEGIHYPTFYVEPGCRMFRHCHVNDKLYMLYSTDSRRLDNREARSNIAIEQIQLD